MANTKEIQKRMKSIQDTMKITSAMYMISSAKLRSAKQKLENTEPYFYSLQAAISRLLRHIPDAKSRYFNQHEEIPDNEKKRGYIVITADKGLAGAYNHNVGDYDKFMEVYEMKKAQLEAAYRRQQQEISELKDFVARNKARVSTRNMAMSRQKKLDKMDVIELAAEKPKPELKR